MSRSGGRRGGEREDVGRVERVRLSKNGGTRVVKASGRRAWGGSRGSSGSQRASLRDARDVDGGVDV